MSFSTHPMQFRQGEKCQRAMVKGGGVGVDNLHLDEPRPIFIHLIALPKINLDSNYSTKFSLKLPLIAGNEKSEGAVGVAIKYT